MKLSLIVPCYNEAENVVPFQDAVIAAYKKCLEDAMGKTVFFVDDDDAANTLREKLQNIPIAYGVYNNIVKNTMVYYNGSFQVLSCLNNYNEYRRALATLWGIELSNDKKNIWLNIIAFLFPLVGLILYLVKRKSRPIMSKSILIFSGIGLSFKMVLNIISMVI